MPKLRNDTETLLVKGIRRGLKTDVDLARYARISTSTLQRWRKEAAAGNEQCQKIIDAMETAWAERRAYIIMRMEQSGADDWRMWRDLLALSDPKNYGKEQNINANVTASVAVKGYVGISPDDWDDNGGVQAASVAGGAVEGQESDSAFDG